MQTTQKRSNPGRPKRCKIHPSANKIKTIVNLHAPSEMQNPSFQEQHYHPVASLHNPARATEPTPHLPATKPPCASKPRTRHSQHRNTASARSRGNKKKKKKKKKRKPHLHDEIPPALARRRRSVLAARHPDQTKPRGGDQPPRNTHLPPAKRPVTLHEQMGEVAEVECVAVRWRWRCDEDDEAEGRRRRRRA